MNRSAARRHLIAAILIAAFLFVVGYGVWWASSKPALSPKGEWATHHLADPVEIVVGDSTVRVTRFVLNLDRALLTLEQDELAFNDYGDATRTGGKPPLAIPVRLSREGENLFRIVPTTKLQQQLRLVVSPTPATAHRLIVLPDNTKAPERILALRGAEIVPDELGDHPQPDHFHFGAIAPRPIMNRDEKPNPLKQISVSGSLAAGALLSIDPNILGFDPDGTINMTTQLGWVPHTVTFQSIGPDPANRGRRAFSLQTAERKRHLWQSPHVTPRDLTDQYILVLGPTELSEHRLVVKARGVVTQVLSLREFDRGNHCRMLKKLDGVPADEREAFRELAKAAGYQITVEAHDGHVRSLQHLRGDTSRYNAILARFPQLRGLTFIHAAVQPSGMASLAQMKHLAGIEFRYCKISDGGLESIGRATGLKHLIFYDCEGPTVAGLVHLAPLTNLSSLEIRDDQRFVEGPPFDDGLRHFVGMQRLLSLNLSGQPLTDAGLEHLGRITTLSGLYLSGRDITAEGLRHLQQLTALEHIKLDGSRIDSTTMNEFRHKLPKLRPGP